MCTINNTVQINYEVQWIQGAKRHERFFTRLYTSAGKISCICLFHSGAAVRPVYDGEAAHHGPLHHRFKGLQAETNHRDGLPDDCTKSVSVAGSDAAAPTNRLVEDLQGVVAHVFSTVSLLGYMFSVRG